MSETFFDAVKRLCAAAHELRVYAAVMLHYERGPIGIAIDNAPFITDEMRLWTVTDEAWHLEPVLTQLRRKLAVLGPEVIDSETFFGLAYERGYTGPERAPFAAPLLAPSGWFGTVVCTAETPPGVEVEQRLALLATHLSVWCTQRGVAALPDVKPLAQRQYEVAILAAKGQTNPEIADALGISVNTVKSRLKQAYERLRVDSRPALAAMLRRLAPLDGVPPGISRRDGYTITRRP